MSQENGSPRGAENKTDNQKKELEKFSSFLEKTINSDEYTFDSYQKCNEEIQKAIGRIHEHGENVYEILDEIDALHFSLAGGQGDQASVPNSFEEKVTALKNKLKELQGLVELTLAEPSLIDTSVDTKNETVAEFPGQKEFEKNSGFKFESDRIIFPLGVGEYKIAIPGYTLDSKKPLEFFNSAFSSEGSVKVNYEVDGKPATISIETKPNKFEFRIQAWLANQRNKEWNGLDLGGNLKKAREFLVSGLLPDLSESKAAPIAPPEIPQAALTTSSDPIETSDSTKTDSLDALPNELVTKDGKKVDLHVAGFEHSLTSDPSVPGTYKIFYFEPGQESGQEQGWNFTFSVDEDKKEFILVDNNKGEVNKSFPTIDELVKFLQKEAHEELENFHTAVSERALDSQAEWAEKQLAKLNFSAKELGQIIPEAVLQELYASMLQSDGELAKTKFAEIFDNQSHADNSVITKRLDAAGLSWEDFVLVWKRGIAEKVYDAVAETARQEMSRLAEKKLSLLDKVKALKNPVLFSAILNGGAIALPSWAAKIILTYSGAQAIIGREASNSIVGALGGMGKRLFAKSRTAKELQHTTKSLLENESKKYEDQILAELFAENSNKKVEMGSWIAQALREIGKQTSDSPDSDPAHLAIFRQEAAKKLAAEAAEEESENGSIDAVRETVRKAQLEALVAGLQTKQETEHVSLESKPAWQKWAQTTLDTLSGKLWLPKKEDKNTNSQEKKSFFRKERLGDAAAVVVGATVGYAFSAGTEVTRLALTTVTGAAAGFEMGRKKDVALANERFIVSVKKEVDDLNKLISNHSNDTDAQEKIASGIIKLQAMLNESTVQQDKGLSAYIHETLAEAMPIASEILLEDLSHYSTDLQEQIKKQQERLTKERTKGWRKVLYGVGGAVSGFVAGLGVNSVMEKIHTSWDSANARQHGATNTAQSAKEIDTEGATPVYSPKPRLRLDHQLPESEQPSVSRAPEATHSQARGLDESVGQTRRGLDEPVAPARARDLELDSRVGRQPVETKSSGYSEILSVEAKKGSSTSGLLDKLKKTELASYTSDEQKNAWSELIADKTKFHNWKVEQLQNMGYTYENGVGFTGHPMAIHKGADLKVVWDADNHKFVAGFGDEHVTKYAHTHVRDVQPTVPEHVAHTEAPASPAKAVITEFKNNPEFKTEVTHSLGKDLAGNSAHHEILDIQPNPKNPDQVLVNLGGEASVDSATDKITYGANQWFPAEVTRLPDGRLSLSPASEVASQIVTAPASARGAALVERVATGGGNSGGSSTGTGETGNSGKAANATAETSQSAAQTKVSTPSNKDGKSISTGVSESGNKKVGSVEKAEPAVRRAAQEKGSAETRREFEDTPDDIKRGDVLQEVESTYQDLAWTRGEKAAFNNYLRFASWQNDLLGAKGSGLEKIVTDNGLANVKDPAVKQWLENTKADLLQRQNNTTKILEDGVNSKKDFVKIRSELRRAGMFGINQISENTQLSDTPANLNFYKDNILLPQLKKSFEPIQEELDIKTVNGQ